MKIQRAPHIYMEWEEGTLVARRVGSDIKCQMGPQVVELLDRIREPVGRAEVVAEYPDGERASVESTVDGLIGAGFIEEEGSASEPKAGDETWWDAWGTQARAFHFATRDADFFPFRSEQSREFIEFVAAEGPPPPLYKSYPDSRRIPLPPHREITTPMSSVLENRRTHRTFHDTPVTLEAFSTVLHYTFAPLGYQDTGPLGVQMVKASPAGGSRHDIECYVACFHVEGIPEGLYHYCGPEHALELIRSDLSRQAILDLTDQQGHCVDGAFTCFLTTVPDRIASKYRHPRAYRLWIYNVGHAAQTFALTCTALGLGPFQTAAFHDSGLEKELRIDPQEEFLTYVLGAGVPVLSERGLPADFWPADPPAPGEVPRSSSAGEGN